MKRKKTLEEFKFMVKCLLKALNSLPDEDQFKGLHFLVTSISAQVENTFQGAWIRSMFDMFLKQAEKTFKVNAIVVHMDEDSEPSEQSKSFPYHHSKHHSFGEEFFNCNSNDCQSPSSSTATLVEIDEMNPPANFTKYSNCINVSDPQTTKDQPSVSQNETTVPISNALIPYTSTSLQKLTSKRLSRKRRAFQLNFNYSRFLKETRFATYKETAFSCQVVLVKRCDDLLRLKVAVPCEHTPDPLPAIAEPMSPISASIENAITAKIIEYPEKKKYKKPKKKVFTAQLSEEGDTLVAIMNKKTRMRTTHRCFHCPKTYAKRKSLIVHYIQHPGYCHDCGQLNGTTASEIIEHNRQFHIAQYPYICDQCGESSTRNQQLQAHMKTHLNNGSLKELICQECNSKFEHIDQFKEHLLQSQHRGAICPICSEYFDGDEALQKHITKKHTKSEPTTCPICSVTFSSRNNLDRHMSLHNEKIKTFVCEHCGMKYLSMNSLREHVKTAHGLETHCCEDCAKIFKHQRSLQRHRKTHSTDCPFVCDTCDQPFKLKANLVRHKRQVHKELPPEKKIKRAANKDSTKSQSKVQASKKLVAPSPSSSSASTTTFHQYTENLYYASTDQVAVINPPANQIKTEPIPNSTNIMEFVAQPPPGSYECENSFTIVPPSMAANQLLGDYHHQHHTHHHNTQPLNSYPSYHPENPSGATGASDVVNFQTHPGNVAASGNGFNTYSNDWNMQEVTSGEYMQVEMPQQNNVEMLQYQNFWAADNTQMDYTSDINTNQAVNTYNNIGNILTNLELLGNNSNFDSSNFEIITSNNYDQTSSVSHQNHPNSSQSSDGSSNNMSSYFNIQPSSASGATGSTMDPNIHNFKNHHITDISNTFLTETQRNNLQYNNYQQATAQHSATGISVQQQQQHQQSPLGDSDNSMIAPTNQNLVQANSNENVILPSLSDYLHHPLSSI